MTFTFNDAMHVVMDDIIAERGRQHEKFGQQDLPSHHPHLSKPGAIDAPTWYDIPHADLAKARVESAVNSGELSWAEIALEEFCEAIEAPDETALRAELVQCAAVLVAWVECIDRNATGPSSDSSPVRRWAIENAPVHVEQGD